MGEIEFTDARMKQWTKTFDHQMVGLETHPGHVASCDMPTKVQVCAAE